MGLERAAIMPLADGPLTDPPRVRAASGTEYRASLNKWWFNDLYHLLFIVIGGRIAAFPVVVRPSRSSMGPSTASAD